MKKKQCVVAIACGIVFLLVNQAAAILLDDEYSLSVTSEQVDTHAYVFTYSVTNNNQEADSASAWTGFDGFFIQIPESAIISAITSPNSLHGSPGYWQPSYDSTETLNFGSTSISLSDGNQWLSWWGVDPSSVYTTGTTATFSFRADGVALGSSSAGLVTYWHDVIPEVEYLTLANGRNYTGYTTDLLSPVAIPVSSVPEPATFILLGFGIIGLALHMRQRENL